MFGWVPDICGLKIMEIIWDFGFLLMQRGFTSTSGRQLVRDRPPYLNKGLSWLKAGFYTFESWSASYLPFLLGCNSSGTKLGAWVLDRPPLLGQLWLTVVAPRPMEPPVVSLSFSASAAAAFVSVKYLEEKMYHMSGSPNWASYLSAILSKDVSLDFVQIF